MIYLVTESSKNLEKIINISKIACEENIGYLQIRNKEISKNEFRNLTNEILKFKKSTKIIINDYADLAYELNVDGLHIGQNDIDPIQARKIIGGKILGLSIENTEQAEISNKYDLNYVAVSPIFRTNTKKNAAPPLALPGLRKIKKISRFPVFAIGGISLNNARKLISSGADACCIVSAIYSSNNPREIIQKFNKIYSSNL